MNMKQLVRAFLFLVSVASVAQTIAQISSVPLQGKEMIIVSGLHINGNSNMKQEYQTNRYENVQ